MNDLEERQRIEQATYLRVYFGDEDAQANADGGTRCDYRRSRAEVEAEAFWAGRSPAARHSARVAA